MRRQLTLPPAHLNVICHHGGLGDTIARLPAFRYVNKKFTHVSQTIYVQDAWIALVRWLLPENDRLVYKRLSQATYILRPPVITFDSVRLSSLRLHLTKHAFLIMTDSIPDSDLEYQYPCAPPWVGAGLNYMLKDAGLATSPYVVFTTDFTAPARAWPVAHINGLAQRLRAQGFACVLIGKNEPIYVGDGDDVIHAKPVDGIDPSLFIDFRNEMDLLECLGIMQKAKAVVGVDNGLLHLACCTATPVVIGYTSLRSIHRNPFREAGATECIESDLPGSAHQSEMHFVNHDHKFCPYGDYADGLTMTADRFEQALVRLGVLVSKQDK